MRCAKCIVSMLNFDKTEELCSSVLPCVLCIFMFRKEDTFGVHMEFPLES